jgi:hypothetical protein
MADDKTGLEQAQEQGYIGSVAADPPNESYTVAGQGDATVKAEREALRKQRTEQQDASGEGEPAKPAKSSGSKSSSSGGGSSS